VEDISTVHMQCEQWRRKKKKEEGRTCGGF
jgi:hypothetical protein